MKLKNIIKHLRVGVDADIWYDAGLYQDTGTAKQIAKVQKAMRAAADDIEESLAFAKALEDAPITVVKAPCPGPRDWWPEVCDTTSQEGHDPRPFGATEEEVCVALDSLALKQDVTDAVDKLIAKLRDIEDLSAIMRQRQREGTAMPLDELERRLKWCKDECRMLVRKVALWR